MNIWEELIDFPTQAIERQFLKKGNGFISSMKTKCLLWGTSALLRVIAAYLPIWPLSNIRLRLMYDRHAKPASQQKINDKDDN